MDAFQMIASRPWLMASSVASQFRRAFSAFVYLHRRIISDTYRKWREQIDPVFIKQLDKCVLNETQSHKQIRVFVINLDR